MDLGIENLKYERITVRLKEIKKRRALRGKHPPEAD